MLCSCDRPNMRTDSPATDVSSRSKHGDAKASSSDCEKEDQEINQKDGGLRLRLSMTKVVYQERQPLEAQLFLENVGSTDLLVLQRGSHVDIGINASNESGEFITTLLPPEPPPPATVDDFVTLAAGESLKLKEWELLNRVNQQVEAGNGRLGIFTVTATYFARPETVDRVQGLSGIPWTGTLTSNSVIVTYESATAPSQ